MESRLISVVMAYYNRRLHLINSLHSMNKSHYKNFEVIIVDDASDEEHRIEDLQNQFNFYLKLIRIEKHEKTHTNPCIPTNIAISHASGDIIIIQNPECFHYDDVFSHVINNLNKNDYFAYSTVNKNIVNQLDQIHDPRRELFGLPCILFRSYPLGVFYYQKKSNTEISV